MHLLSYYELVKKMERHMWISNVQLESR